MKFAMVIVLYNEKINQSLTFQCVKDSPATLVLVDNSPTDEIRNYNQTYAADHNIIYLTKNANIGLSQAYNLALTTIKTLDVDYVIMLDDDTNISPEYLSLLQNFDFKPQTLYTPLIYNDSGVLVNPNYHSDNYLFEYIKTKKYNSQTMVETLVGTDKLYAINSGLIIPINFFNQFSYDENIFLDCVDHYCCKQAYKLGYTVDIFPTSIVQNYSVDSIAQNSVESNFQRLNIRLHDTKVYNKSTFFINKLIYIAMYILKTKNLSYLKLIFRRY